MSYCPRGAVTVYSGFAASAQYQTKGSGANFMCLTSKPVYSNYKSGRQGRAMIAPVEYHPNGIMGSIWDKNAPCAVCHRQCNADAVMIPGTIKCPSSWRREYYGYLMTSADDYRRSDYICVEKKPQSVRGSAGHTQQASDIFNVEAHCSGRIMCPPYNSYKEITCVVCTK